MAAKAVSTLPAEKNEWIFEVKWDGYRLLVYKNGEEVRLTSRNNKDLTAKYPSIVAAARRIKGRSFLLDGELVALDRAGYPSFELLQSAGSSPPMLAYYAFDLLSIGGKLQTSNPLGKRRRDLETLLKGDQPDFRISVGLSGDPADVIRGVEELGLEGVVAKRLDSLYIPGERSGAWLKVKLSPQQEFVVGGFESAGRRGVESLIVGYYQGVELLCAGTVRQGLTSHNRLKLAEVLKPHAGATCPFANLPALKSSRFGGGITADKMEKIQWVYPRLVVQVAFVSWTRNLQLRHAAYKGMRHDKEPSEVGREITNLGL